MKAIYMGMTVATMTGILWVILTMASCQKTEAQQEDILPCRMDRLNNVACYCSGNELSCVKL
jgi:hypothetical protein